MIRFILLLLLGLLLLGLLLLRWGSWRFEQSYRRDVRHLLRATATASPERIQEQDLAQLPVPVQAYLRYVGVVGQPKVYNALIRFKGKMRERGKDWFPFHSEQHNGFRDFTRLFFMKGTLSGMQVPGYHRYQGRDASMNIRLFGWFPVVQLSGTTLFKAETVTLFNDMCLLAPATLIDPRIQWEAIDSSTARATFHNAGVTIQATLYFNAEGQLINFVSDDRYAVAEMQQYRFSTPVSKYRNFGAFRLPSFGEAVWHYPEGAFSYGQFELQEVHYNVAAP